MKRKLITSPLLQLVVVWLAVLAYCESRVYDLLPEEPIGLGFMFFAAIFIVRTTPHACEQLARLRKAK